MLAGLGGMFGWGLADFFAKKTIDKIGDFKTLLWAQTFGILPTFIFLLFNWGPVNLKGIIVPLLLVFSLADLMAYFLFYRGLKKGLVSILSPVFAAQSGVAVLVSALIFKEAIEPWRWLGLIITFIGIILASFQPLDSGQKFNFKNLAKGLPEVLAGMIIFGFFFPCWDWFLEYQGEGWIVSSLLARIFVVVILLAVIYLFALRQKSKPEIDVKGKKLWFWLILIGLFDAGAALATAWGYKFTDITSVVVVIAGAFPLPTVILARIFLKERLVLNQIIGIAAIITGLIILAV